MRDFTTSEYNRTIGIKLEKLLMIDTIRGRKSKAGKLDEIIEFYFDNKNLWSLLKNKKKD